jgi:hypothetical protein
LKRAHKFLQVDAMTQFARALGRSSGDGRGRKERQELARIVRSWRLA